MVNKKSHSIPLIVALLLLLLITGCAGGFAKNQTTAVSSEIVSATMNYVEGSRLGPPYNVTVRVPSDWVGDFELRNIGNKLYFDYIGGDGTSQIFFIEALSADQYWRQIGGYPGSYANIVNKGNTYFVYYLPIDAYYSGLSEEDFVTFSEAVPQIVESFMVEAQ